MKARNSILKLIALVAVIATGAIWGADGVSASLNSANSKILYGITQDRAAHLSRVNLEDEERDDPFFRTGMFGITQNQTARLSLANADDGSFVPCIRVELSFVDSEGKILSQKVYDVEAGKSAFLDLRGDEIVRRSSSRSQIRAVFRFVGTPDTRLYMWLPTVEVFDNESGETRFVLSAEQKVQKVQMLRQ